MGNELCAIADTQNGNTANKLAEVYLESLRIVYRIGGTTEDDAND